MNSKLIGRLRFWFLNKPRHRREKEKQKPPGCPMSGRNNGCA